MPTGTLIYRVKLTHRPHYSGYTACAFHAKEAAAQGIYEVRLLEAHEIQPLPAHAIAAGHTHCYTCNREKGIGLSHHPASRVEVG